MEFSMGMGCHFLLQVNLPDPGIKSTSLASLALAADSLPLRHLGSLLLLLLFFFFFLTPKHWALWDGHEEREVRMQSNLENFSLRINGLVEP